MWNYRVFKKSDEEFGLVECYYDKDGKPEMRSQDFMAPFGEDISALEADLERMVAAYEIWLNERRIEAAQLSGMIRIAADDHLIKCAAALVRMREGIKLLRTNPDIKRAFQLANLAVLSQQLYTPQNIRKAELDKDGVYKVDALPPKADWRTVEGKGSWRSFQIGFLLSNLSSTDPEPRIELLTPSSSSSVANVAAHQTIVRFLAFASAVFSNALI
jgi:hypothetical protein